MEKTLNWLSILAAAGAAIFWWWSAVYPISPKIDMTWGGDAKLFMEALQRVAQLNSWAAICAGFSVFFQAIIMLRKKSGYMKFH